MSEYLEELERAARGESVSPKRLAFLKRIEDKETKAADDLAAVTREIERARAAYLSEGEKRMEAARPKAEQAHAELIEARAKAATAYAELEAAKEKLAAAIEKRRGKFGKLWQIADEVWERGGVPRDNDGNPTVDLCAYGGGRVVLGDTLVHPDRDTELLW